MNALIYIVVISPFILAIATILEKLLKSIEL